VYIMIDELARLQVFCIEVQKSGSQIIVTYVVHLSI
jgi:hypothetical protein